MRKARFLLAAAVAVTATAGLSMAPAHAATDATAGAQVPHGCAAPFFLEVSNAHHYFVDKPGGAYNLAGSAGVTLTMTVARGTTVGTQYTATTGNTVGLSAEILSLQARKDFSNSIQNSVTNTVTVSGSYKVTKYAVLHYGAAGYEYSWEKGYIAGGPSKCVVHITGKGTAKSPASTPGFNVTGS